MVTRWIDIPDRLVLVDGKLEMSDGSDVQAYLRDFQARAKIADGTLVNVVTRKHAAHMELVFSRAA